ncbi:hypothetical protein BPUTSESOX_1032 [uncultured Gammaproteobacteria bacterium]|nr:hypothetical protein [uncultured Gammaproteobacteria bacterium]SSC09558.1 hypothetical protein BPUTEOSOX_1796 [thiotrophic endosymbiont of Bathymodiolus puteoserpentis (Logatchev)]VVH52021.1 hypothetical protein BPUTSESOX_1032 [uncultured Gammaproteobacteria bacterium]
MGWFFRILIGIFWVGWFYFWIWVKLFQKKVNGKLAINGF